MAGTKEGARKARETNLAKDPDYYSKIGQKSWSGERSHEHGFATLDKETLKEISARGGKKTKEDYQKASADTEAEEERTGSSE